MQGPNCYMPTFGESGKLVKKGNYCNWEAVVAHLSFRCAYDVITKEIGFTNFNANWVFPTEGDQCWTNINCSMAKADVVLSEEFFKTAYKNPNN